MLTRSDDEEGESARMLPGAPHALLREFSSALACVCARICVRVRVEGWWFAVAFAYFLLLGVVFLCMQMFIPEFVSIFWIGVR